jgi:hypothetical protein
MKKHTKIYLDAMGYDQSDFIPCEICEKKAVDIHHINARGMGGNPLKDKDVIENLQALCRECHISYGDQRVYKRYLKERHELAMQWKRQSSKR